MTESERNAVVATLRDAARRVVDGQCWDVRHDGACDAIWLAGTIRGSIVGAKTRVVFTKIIGSTRPRIERSNAYFWPRDEEHRGVRVIALLLAADVVEAGDW